MRQEHQKRRLFRQIFTVLSNSNSENGAKGEVAMIFNIISVIALILGIYSAWGVYQNTKAIGYLCDSLDEIKKAMEKFVAN